MQNIYAKYICKIHVYMQNIYAKYAKKHTKSICKIYMQYRREKSPNSKEFSYFQLSLCFATLTFTKDIIGLQRLSKYDYEL